MKSAAGIAAALALGLLASAAPAAGNAAPRKGRSCCAEDGSEGKTCASPAAVTLVGTVLCEHCDLHVAKSCNPVFKADGRAGFLPFCPETKDVAAIQAASDRGKAKIEVKGKICRSKDGRELLEVESYARKG